MKLLQNSKLQSYQKVIQKNGVIWLRDRDNCEKKLSKIILGDSDSENELVGSLDPFKKSET